MEQEKETEDNEPRYYIVCRFSVEDDISFDKLITKSLATRCNLELSLKAMKKYSRHQPGVFILFDGGGAWGDGGNLCYYPLWACQDGRTLQITTDEKYKYSYDGKQHHNPYDGKHLYTHGDNWEFTPDYKWCYMFAGVLK